MFKPRWDPVLYSTKKGYSIQEKETSLGKIYIYGMFILLFKKTYKKY